MRLRCFPDIVKMFIKLLKGVYQWLSLNYFHLNIILIHDSGSYMAEKCVHDDSGLSVMVRKFLESNRFIHWASVRYGFAGLMPGPGFGWYPGSGRVTILSPVTHPAYPLNPSQPWQHQPPRLPYHIPPPHHLMPSNCIQHTLQRQRSEMWLKMVCYFDFLIILYWIIAILGFFRVWMCLEAVGTQENTGGVA